VATTTATSATAATAQFFPTSQTNEFSAKWVRMPKERISHLMKND
jgi:hypothetical protein